ncbi:MAG: NYN domain-containing protein [Eubacteriales bacterium]|nr:NYN domain-containing protein [Eubacteriales bacterium]
MDNSQKMAVLIDADNTQLSKMEGVFHELTTYGRIVVKKAYGNWKKQSLKNWEEEVKRLAIKTEQQFDYVSGKNTTDIAMVIDAMDLLHSEMYDAFALVSSDSDFTPLAIRLRESGAYIIGVGESKTPEAFRNACDDFLLLDFVSMEDRETAEDAAAEEAADAAELCAVNSAGTTASDKGEAKRKRHELNEVHKLLRIAYDRYQDEDGYVNIATSGNYIKRAKPDFTPALYGYTKLSDFLKAYPKKYALKTARGKGKGSSTAVYYKCVKK